MKELDALLVRQGAAMLEAAVKDFLALGMQVATILDPRIGLSIEGTSILHIDGHSSPRELFDAMARDADVALVIAPECGGALAAWLSRLEQLGVRSLNCELQAARLCADKLALAECLKGSSVPTPATSLFATSALPDCDKRQMPLIIKPRLGAGCEETWLCESTSDLESLPSRHDWIVQPRVPGMAASCGLIVHGPQVQSLLPGEQRIMPGRKLRYDGGRLPLPPPLAARAVALAKQAARAVPGLRGYVGVDLILGDDPTQDMAIEINPRLTLSYVALRQLCTRSLTAAMLHEDAPLAWSSGTLHFDATGRIHWEEKP